MTEENINEEGVEAPKEETTSVEVTPAEEVKKIYVGKHAVAQVIPQTQTETVAVIYEDNSHDEFTAEQWEAVMADAPYDDALIPIKKWTPALTQILEILQKNKMVLGDKDFVLNRLDQSLVNNYQKAVNKYFGVEHVSQISLDMIDVALKNDIGIQFKEPVK